MIRALQSPFASLLCFLAGSTTVCAQGTIQFGFEEYDVGNTPPYVASSSKVGSAGTIDSILPFEGQKYLYAIGGTSLNSPDGQLIQSFSFHLFAPKAPFFSAIAVYVAGQRLPTVDFDTWQRIDGALTAPVQTFGIYEINLAQEAGVSLFAIDAVEFATVPEPKAFWFIAIGLGAIVLSSRSKQSNQVSL